LTFSESKRTSSPSTYPKLRKPKYKNAALKNIAEKNGETELDLNWKKLTNEDMEIVAYYALQGNKVSDVVFSVIIRLTRELPDVLKTCSTKDVMVR
jgi:hypothetical protein